MSISALALAVAVLVVMLPATALADEEVALRILPEDRGCVTLLTNAPGGRYAGCPPHERTHRLSGTPQEYPVDLARNAAGEWLLTRRGLHHSSSRGSPWQRLDARGGLTLGCSPKECLWALRSGGVRRVLPDEHTEAWSQGLPEAPVQAVTHDRERGWLATVFAEGIFLRGPGHSAWQPDSTGLGTRNVVAIDCDDQGNCLLGTAGGGLYRRLVDETRWQPLAVPGVSRVTAVAAGVTLWLAITDAGVKASTDQGAHWKDLPLDANATMSAVGVSNEGRYWIGGTEGQLYGARAGSSPALLYAPGWYRVQGLAAQGGEVFMLMDGRLFRAGGLASWQPVDLPGDLKGAVTSLAVDAEGGLLIGSEEGGPMRRRPEDGRWLPHHGGLPEGARVGQLLTAADGAVHLATLGTGAAEQQLFTLPPGEETWQAVVLGGRPESQPYRVRWLVNLAGGTVVAWGTYDVLWKRPEEAFWRQAWFARTPGEPPSIDARGRLWVERGGVYSFNRPGETRWHAGEPSAKRWGAAIPVTPTTWGVHAPGQGDVLLLQDDGKAGLSAVSRWPVPFEGPLQLATGAGERIVA
ncbi:MAG: hypothetical protein RI841_13495, partial [Halomonas sp.]|uniref:hypothetical protein n=1 Tax=Halomonas sp. TaxID=1486246 RepID=UPI00286FE64F